MHADFDRYRWARYHHFGRVQPGRVQRLDPGSYCLKETGDDRSKTKSDHVDASIRVSFQFAGHTNVYMYNCGRKNLTVLPATCISQESAG